MLKRMYIVISLLSIASIMHGMEKRSAGAFLNHTLDQVVGKEGTLTTVEHELGEVMHEAEKQVTLLGVTPKGAYEAAVVFGVLYFGSQTAQYLYNRYFPRQAQPLDPATHAVSQSAAAAHSNVNVLGKFVTATETDALVEAKWNELMQSNKFADKDYVDTATAQVRNMITSALETTAGRVTTLEGQVKGLSEAINGNSADNKIGIRTAHGQLVNRIAALEIANQAASSSAAAPSTAAAHAKEPDNGGGFMSGMSNILGRKKKKRDDSGTHGVQHKHADDDEDEDDAIPTDLHAPKKNNNSTQKEDTL